MFTRVVTTETPSVSPFLGSPERKADNSEDGSKLCGSYYLTDHLGSTRAVVDDAGTVLETFDYYPFGLLMPKRNTAGANSIEKFTSKERDDEGGLNLDYFGARYYDPALGRFLGVDPLAEGAPDWTPYRYAFNNPLKFIDIGGNFELDPALVKKYPRLAEYLKNGIQAISNNSKIMNALMKHGEFTRSDIVNSLKFGQGPKINVTSTPGAYGIYNPKKPNELQISDKFVQALESATGQDRDAILFLVAVTILHEFTHYGDFQDGIQQRDANNNLIEEGNLFEIDAYGKIIVGSNAKSTILNYLKRQEKNSSNNEKKSREAMELLNNFDDLESGTYVWDGSNWVKQEND